MKNLVSKRPLAISLATLVVVMFVYADKSAFGQELSGGDAVEIVAESVKTGVEHVKHTATSRFLKEKHQSKSGTTKAQRKAAERQHKQVISTAKKTGKKLWFKAVDALSAGVGNFEAWATILGHASTGNLTSTTGAAANEMAEAASGTAGALALGKVGLIAGTAIAGPAGGIIGGGILGATGAVLGTLGYKVYLSDAVVNGVEKRFERDHKQYAIENRHEWRLKNDPFYLKPHEREQTDFLFRRTLGKTIEKVAQDHPEVKDTSPNNTYLSGPGTYNPDRWDKLKRRAKTLARKRAANPVADMERDEDTRAVIPNIASIDAAFTHTGADGKSATTRWSFYIRGGTVSGQMIPYNSPPQDNAVNRVSGGTWRSSVTGEIADNVVTGEQHYEPLKFKQVGTDPSDPWEAELTYVFKDMGASVTFHHDGTVDFASMGGTCTITTIFTAGEKAGKTYKITNPNTPQTAFGVWQYRERGEAR